MDYDSNYSPKLYNFENFIHTLFVTLVTASISLIIIYVIHLKLTISTVPKWMKKIKREKNPKKIEHRWELESFTDFPHYCDYCKLIIVQGLVCSICQHSCHIEHIKEVDALDCKFGAFICHKLPFENQRRKKWFRFSNIELKKNSLIESSEKNKVKNNSGNDKNVEKENNKNIDNNKKKILNDNKNTDNNNKKIFNDKKNTDNKNKKILNDNKNTDNNNKKILNDNKNTDNNNKKILNDDTNIDYSTKSQNIGKKIFSKEKSNQSLKVDDEDNEGILKGSGSLDNIYYETEYKKTIRGLMNQKKNEPKDTLLKKNTKKELTKDILLLNHPSIHKVIYSEALLSNIDDIIHNGKNEIESNKIRGNSYYNLREYSINNSLNSIFFGSPQNVDTSFLGILRDSKTSKYSHHWIKCSVNKRMICQVCFESVSVNPPIFDYRCTWCQVSVHINCMNKYGLPCLLSPIPEIVLPPHYVSLATRKKMYRGEVLPKYHVSPININKFINRTPFICIINPKSGEGASNIIKELYSVLNPVQIADITYDKPEEILLSYVLCLSKCKIIVCGGDGTVSWVLSILDKFVKNKIVSSEDIPPIGIIPLGTGNDLARILGWGGGYSGENVKKILKELAFDSEVVKIDRWKVEFGVKLKNKKGLLNKFRFNKRDSKEIVMNNYLSIGSDANIAYAFHSTRKGYPAFFRNRFINKVWYMLLGGVEAWKSLYNSISSRTRYIYRSIFRKNKDISELSLNIITRTDSDPTMNYSRRYSSASNEVSDECSYSAKSWSPMETPTSQPMNKYRNRYRHNKKHKSHNNSLSSPINGRNSIVYNNGKNETNQNNNIKNYTTSEYPTLTINNIPYNLYDSDNDDSKKSISPKRSIKDNNSETDNNNTDGKISHFGDMIELEIDGRDVDVSELSGIIIMNIDSYGGGAKFFPKEDDDSNGFILPLLRNIKRHDSILSGLGSSNSTDEITDSSCYDGHLEVVGIYSVLHAGASLVGMSSPEVLGTVKKKCRITIKQQMAIQIDGEPWIQNPTIIEISFFGKSDFLKRRGTIIH